MTWVKLEDGMPEHPKVVELNVHAKWALVEMWCYCARHQTDGHIGVQAAKRIAKPSVIADLVTAGLVHQNGSGWVMHDWLDHNMSAADYADKKNAEAERLRTYRERKKTGDV